MIFEGTNKIGMGDVLFVPGAGCNLLGRELQLQLGIGVLPEGDKMVVKFLRLKEDEKQIEVVWAKPGNKGKLNTTPIYSSVTATKDTAISTLSQSKKRVENCKSLINQR